MASSRKTTKQPRKDPKGGLTAAGREFFRRKDGSHLKPGVTGAADTPQKLRRKGSFLRRHYANLRGPLIDEKGEPTRLALAAHAWGEPVPKTRAAAAKLARLGPTLLERYQTTKGKKMAQKKNSLVANINRRKRAGKSRTKSKSTVSKDAYKQMEKGWPGHKRSPAKGKREKGKTE